MLTGLRDLHPDENPSSLQTSYSEMSGRRHIYFLPLISLVIKTLFVQFLNLLGLNLIVHVIKHYFSLSAEGFTIIIEPFEDRTPTIANPVLYFRSVKYTEIAFKVGKRH